MNLKLTVEETRLLHARGWIMKEVDGEHLLVLFDFSDEGYEILNLGKDIEYTKFTIQLNVGEDE